MSIKKIQYTVSFTQHPQDWNIPAAVKYLEQARAKALDIEKRTIEESSFLETQKLIERLRKKQ
jgi:hypothetical protein